MTLFSRLFASPRPVARPVTSPVKPRPRVIAPEWLDNAPMSRIILHWTAGSHIASALDREHYHFLVEMVDGQARLVRGQMPVKANVPPLREGQYAAHTLNTNSNSIGISICGMAGATENPLKFGSHPIMRSQWDLAIQAVAELCAHYRIPSTPRTVLTHAEVQNNLGIKQRGKWDIARLSFAPELVGPAAVGGELRARVREFL